MMSGTDNLNGYLNEITEIERQITNAKANIAKIQEFQGLILNSTSTSQEDIATKEREKLVSETRNLLVECKNRVKKIQNDNSRIPSNDPNIVIKRQKYEYIKTKLSNALEDYRQAESNYMEKTKVRMARQYKVVNPNATEQEINDYLSNSDSQPIFEQAVTKAHEAKSALAEVQKRHGDIKRIENTISELVDLVQELQLQVESQDQTIVEIGDNTEQTVNLNEKTTAELGRAAKLARAARKKKWICLGIFLLIIIIIIIVLVVVLKGNSSSSGSPSPSGSPSFTSSPSSPTPTSTTTLNSSQ